ncbi:hypothetical protein NPIL_544131 [Nephila pilipes]|uniref:Uncharacterized protein n=1 Tax=Nephila pilipes TaxID=299642 RepID=A0A8X6P0U4_NEPPI|nr:hypothetical protein NPIL_544131 [Nephila pilipes]
MERLRNFSAILVNHAADMARYLTYDEVMRRLRTMLDTMFTDVEHDSSTDADTYIEVDDDESNETDF